VVEEAAPGFLLRGGGVEGGGEQGWKGTTRCPARRVGQLWPVQRRWMGVGIEEY